MMDIYDSNTETQFWLDSRIGGIILTSRQNSLAIRVEWSNRNSFQLKSFLDKIGMEGNVDIPKENNVREGQMLMAF